jgi:hypothetical protein
MVSAASQSMDRLTGFEIKDGNHPHERLGSITNSFDS